MICPGARGPAGAFLCPGAPAAVGKQVHKAAFNPPAVGGEMKHAG